MRVGATISGAGHLGLLALAVIGLEPASAPEDRVIQARDVSIVSLAAFNAAVSEAPEVPDVAASALNAPEVSQSVNETPAELEAAEAVPEAEVPDAPDPDAAPDLSTFAIPDPELTTVAPEPDPAPVGEDLPLLAGPSFDGSLNSNETALRAPAPAALAPRIDTSAAPKPPERSEAAPLPREASIPSDQTEQLPEEEAAAPEAATTEITPDAVEQEEVHTPTAAMRPPGRPRALLAEKAEAEERAEEEARQAAEDAKRAEEEAIAAALAEATAEPEPSGTRLGGDFSSGEKRAVGAFIDPFWNKSILTGKANYEDLVVIVRVRLAADGRLLGGVEPVSPANPSGDFSVAFQAARRAVIQAANAGLPLPSDKFRDGDFLEIRFDPGRGAVSFD